MDDAHYGNNSIFIFPIINYIYIFCLLSAENMNIIIIALKKIIIKNYTIMVFVGMYLTGLKVI